MSLTRLSIAFEALTGSEESIALWIVRFAWRTSWRRAFLSAFVAERAAERVRATEVREGALGEEGATRGAADWPLERLRAVVAPREVRGLERLGRICSA